MVIDLNDHELRPAKGSKIPQDVPGLVGEFLPYLTFFVSDIFMK